MMWQDPELDLEGVKPKHPDGDICLWRYKLCHQLWESDCDFLMGARQLKRSGPFNYCPNCGKKMVKEPNHG